MEQLHKRFTNDQVKQMIKRYLNHEVERKYVQSILGISKAHFFRLINHYRENPHNFSVAYKRTAPTRQIDPAIEVSIIKELEIDKRAIQNKEIPLKCYNYSYVKEQLETKYAQSVSLPTVINRAKKHGFYLKERKQKIHDREVITRYAGELIQHDSSHHLWAPASKEKWYLITSLDDFSRYLLYAILLKRENVWAHIHALETLILRHGLPFSIYVDCHSIFRFVRGRDELHYKHHLLTDDVDPQWKQIVRELGIQPIYALSPQAKGKIERPYRWIQDHLIRTCIREDVKDIREANRILGHEVHAYNYKRIHSTTNEIPYLRFQRALREKQSLFREFMLKPPFQSVKDIFSLRFERTANSYRKVSLNNTEFKVNGVSPHNQILLRLYPLNKELVEVRFWNQDKLVDIQKIKTKDLELSPFNL